MLLSDPDLYPDCCETNVDSYITRFGGVKIQGVYVLKHISLPLYQLIRHFIVFDGKDYIDITPFIDNRTHNYFVPIVTDTANMFIQSLDHINKYTEQETELMYYVYCYLDPETKLPFYVGKGSQNRAYTHMYLPREKNKNKNKTRFKNKLEKMKQQGIEPVVVFLAQNITDEEMAYSIEESFIKQYGRLGYEEHGTLLNTCLGSRPPNHKGKTYEQIYGPGRAAQQREKRARLQKERGGYGPKKHKTDTKDKIREKTSGTANPMYGRQHSDSSKNKIGQSNKKYVGRLNKKSQRWQLISPHNETHILYGNELDIFCKLNNLNAGTFRVGVCKGWPPSSKGKNAGWVIKRLPALQSDIDDNSFRGFSL